MKTCINKIWQILLILLITSSALTSFADSGYILPETDYRPDSTSAPCITGEISSVTSSMIIVKGSNRSDVNARVKVGFDSDTSIFTVYGGYIHSSQLNPGQKLRIWYKGKSCKEPDTPLVAARVMIASENPNDDWPK